MMKNNTADVVAGHAPSAQQGSSVGKHRWLGRRTAVFVAALVVIIAISGGGLRRDEPSPILRTVALRQGAVSVAAVDAQTGRAFAVETLPAGNASVMHMLDAATGAVRHTTALTGAPVALAVDAQTRRVFVAHGVPGSAMGVSALDTRDGALRRTMSVAPIFGALAVDEQGGHIVVADADAASYPGLADHSAPWSTLRVLNAGSGAVERTWRVRGQIVALASDGRRGHLIALDKLPQGGVVADTLDRRGRRLRRIGLGMGTPTSIVVDETTARAFVVFDIGSTPPAGLVFVLDTRGGLLVNTIRLDGPAGSAALDEQRGRVDVLTQGRVRQVTLRQGGVAAQMFVPVGPGHLVILNARSGTLQRTVPIQSSPSDMALDERTGHLLIGFAGPSRTVVTSTNGQRMFGSLPVGPGTLEVLDGATGTPLRTLTIGYNPGPIVVDARTARAFVARGGGWWMCRRLTAGLGFRAGCAPGCPCPALRMHRRARSRAVL